MTSAPPPFQHPGPPPLRPELPDGAPEPPAARDTGPRLGVPWWTPFVAMLAAFAGVLVIATGISIVVAIVGGDPTELADSDGMVIGLTVAQDALLIVTPIAIVWLIAGRPLPPAFGFVRTRFWPALGWAFVAYMAFVIAALAIQATIGEPEEQELVTELRAEDSVIVLVGFAALTCFVAPIAEEFFFRGFMFRALAERMHVAWATLITGVAFGIVHLPGGDLVSVLALGVLGALLCLLLWRTGSLLPCIMLHAFFNSIAFGDAKELPWWGFLLLIAGSVTATLAVSLPALRSGRRAASAPA
jgi:membrane protease YdiL (CAAX protease family)